MVQICIKLIGTDVRHIYSYYFRVLCIDSIVTATAMTTPAEKVVYDPHKPPEDRYIIQYVTAFSGNIYSI